MSLLALVYAPTIREQLERLAYWSLLGKVQDSCLPKLLPVLCPDVDTAFALNVFTSLVEAVLLRDDHGGGQEPVDEALNLLLGGVA